MITLRSKREIELLREAGKIVAETHAVVKEAIKPGISTWELDQLAYQTIVKHGAIPSFLNYNGFPGSICASRNEIIVHGIPSSANKTHCSLKFLGSSNLLPQAVEDCLSLGV